MTRNTFAGTGVDPSIVDPAAQEGTVSSAGVEVTWETRLFGVGAAGLAKDRLVDFSGPPGVRAVKATA